VRRRTIRLLRLMDKDRNGSVSRDEFMQFMSQAFDRFDLNKSGALESGETNIWSAFGIRTRAAASSDAQQLLCMMDSDKNGAVTKDEFLRFMSQAFNRLDVDKNERLEREELRRLSDPNGIICHDLRIC
jgi:Ca2+-binding EF-hand superfamily protein